MSRLFTCWSATMEGTTGLPDNKVRSGSHAFPGFSPEPLPEDAQESQGKERLGARGLAPEVQRECPDERSALVRYPDGLGVELLLAESPGP